MSKIILTVEQDKEIKRMSEKFSRQRLLADHIEVNDWTHQADCLNCISINQMARILYEPGSYEVKQPKIKVNDFIVGLNTGNVYKTVEVAYDNSLVGEVLVSKTSIKGNKVTLNSRDVRLATPSEIIFAELGREVGEFEIGDAYEYIDGDVYNIVDISFVGFAKDAYLKNKLKGFYPATSYIEFPKQ